MFNPDTSFSASWRFARAFVGVASVSVFTSLGCGRNDVTSQDERRSISLESLEQRGAVEMSEVTSLPDVSALEKNSAASRAGKLPSTDESSNESTDVAKPTDLKDASPAQLREAALRAFGNGEEDLAFELVRKARRLAPKDPDVTFFYAMVLADRHRFEEACKILDRLAEREPKIRLPVLGQTAQWMVESAHYEEAERRFREILEEASDSPRLHHHLGLLLFQLGKRTEAAEHYRYLAQLGELNQEELRSLLSVSKPFPRDAEANRLTPLSELARARQQMALDDFDGALAVLDAIEEGTDEVSSLRARLLVEKRDWQSLRDWATSREIGKYDADGWFVMGSLAANEKDHRKAIECFCNALLVDQTDAEVYERLRESLLAMGQDGPAAEANARSKLILQTQEIGAVLSRGQVDDRARIAELAALLVKLNRPLEALGWQGIDLVYAAGASQISESDAERAFSAITEFRRQLLDSGQYEAPVSFIVCGLDLPEPGSLVPDN